MASKLLRRSGVAIGLIAELIGWRPDWICQVGVGLNHQEIDVLVEEWGWKGQPEKVIGFEANAAVIQKVRNNYPGKLEHLAVSDKCKKVLLNFRESHKDGSSLKEIGDVNRSEEVECIPLDMYFKTTPKGNGLLLLDCEGSELDVLVGARYTIRSFEAVNVEMTANPLGYNWADPVYVHEVLSRQGFWQQWVHTQRATAGQYDAIYVRKSLFKPQYCCNVYEQMRWRNSR